MSGEFHDRWDEEAVALIRRFATEHKLACYDSTLCWGCGKPKYDDDGNDCNANCEPDCLLANARAFVAEDERAMLAMS